MGRIIDSFSYSMKDMEIIESAKEIAKRNDENFSEFILKAVKERVNRQKKVEGSEDSELDSPFQQYIDDAPNIFESISSKPWITYANRIPRDLCRQLVNQGLDLQIKFNSVLKRRFPRIAAL